MQGPIHGRRRTKTPLSEASVPRVSSSTSRRRQVNDGTRKMPTRPSLLTTAFAALLLLPGCSLSDEGAPMSELGGTGSPSAGSSGSAGSGGAIGTGGNAAGTSGSGPGTAGSNGTPGGAGTGGAAGSGGATGL